MGDPKQKLIDTFFPKGTQDLVDSAQKGAFTVRAEDGTPLEITDAASLRHAHESGANGKVSFWNGEEHVTATLEGMRQAGPMSMEQAREIPLAFGDKAVNHLRRLTNEELNADAERNAEGFSGFINNFSEGGVNVGRLIDGRTEQEKLLGQKNAEAAPLATTLGGIGAVSVAAGLGGAVVGAATNIGKGAILASQIVGEGVGLENSQAKSFNRTFQVESAATDMMYGGAFFVGAKALSVGLRSSQGAVSALVKEARFKAKAGEHMADSAASFSKKRINGTLDDVAFDNNVRILDSPEGLKASHSWVNGNRARVKGAPKELNRFVADVSDDVAQVAKTPGLISKQWLRSTEAARAAERGTAAKWVDLDATKGAFSELEQKLRALEETGSGGVQTLAKKARKRIQSQMKILEKGDAGPAQIQRNIHEDASWLHETLSKPSNKALKTGDLGRLAQDMTALKKNPKHFGEAGVKQAALDKITVDMREARDFLQQKLTQSGGKKGLSALVKNGDELNVVELNNKIQEIQDMALRASRLDIPGIDAQSLRPMMEAANRLDAKLRAATHAGSATTEPGIFRVMQMSQEFGLDAQKAVAKSGGMFGTIVRAGITAGGYKLGGFPGGIAAGAAVNFFGKAFKGGGRGAEAAAHSANRVKVSIKAGASQAADTLRNPAKAANIGRTLQKSSRIFRSKKEKREDFQDTVHRLKQTAENPDHFVTEVEMVASAAVDTDMTAPLLQQYVNTVYHMVNQIPTEDIKSASATVIDEFMGKMDIVADPFTAMEHFQFGTFTEGMRETFGAVYPTLYGDMIAEVMAEVGGDIESLPYSSLMKLKMFTGIAFDKSMKPEYMATFHNKGAQTQQQDAMMNGVGPQRVVNAKAVGGQQNGIGRIVG